MVHCRFTGILTSEFLLIYIMYCYYLFYYTRWVKVDLSGVLRLNRKMVLLCGLEEWAAKFNRFFIFMVGILKIMTA